MTYFAPLHESTQSVLTLESICIDIGDPGPELRQIKTSFCGMVLLV